MFKVFKTAIKAFLTAWFRLILIMVVFRAFVLVFGTLFSQTDDFYSYHLFGKQPLSSWISLAIFTFVLSLILSFIGDCIEKHKNNKK